MGDLLVAVFLALSLHEIGHLAFDGALPFLGFPLFALPLLFPTCNDVVVRLVKAEPAVLNQLAVGVRVSAVLPVKPLINLYEQVPQPLPAKRLKTAIGAIHWFLETP